MPKPQRAIVRTIHASGLYSSSLKALTRVIVLLMGLRGVSLISGTEADGRPDGFLRHKGWGFAHGAKNSAESRQLWLAWRERRWSAEGEPRAVLTSDQRYFTKGGRPKGSHHVLRVRLRDRKTDRLFIVYVVHMSLDNTATRAALWVDECQGLVGLLDKDARTYPGCIQLVQGDMNKNWRDDSDRHACEKHLAIPAGLECVWDNHLPATGGTHGPKSILDHAYVRGYAVRFVGSKLLAVTALLRRASDHFPFRAKLRYLF